ncbi:MAG TPA: sigma-70 family RNA polymerase sigma factor [candidate division Zixibacteria bacterium]|nr:sigma-70 family RNA polymerase sigma factor [candidate division Zixibacteria bacterium]
MKINRPDNSGPDKDKDETRGRGRPRGKKNVIDSNEKFEYETIQIIKKIREGEDLAFNDLIERYKRQVAAVAFRMVGDYDEAEDIAQMVFVKTAKNLNKFDITKKFSTWLYRITVNASIDFMRKHKRHKHELIDNYSESLENEEDNPEEILNRKKLRGIILKAADTLNDKQKAAFILRDLEGHQIDEVSEILDMPEATVRWYLHRARIRLRKELKRNYGGYLGEIYNVNALSGN